ncbi:LytR/AlgR family response regulator transcription factor [Qiania dongpingensis]|uniref:Stage 0 sporulation protein A homolog n=1 Tax=Qiania dongpingensis TaxID=2763669 RepID=A0A7G9G3E0_9FIRM|nr:LytTR family DNA-binding domain-containing protein [Qiania dongpingensis]QNM05322.1 response regulator transcription factor [Qiania dongpingensis]
MYRIMVCDDDKADREKTEALVIRLMERLGEACRTEYAASPEELLRAREKGAEWDLILLDILMDGPSGLQLAEELHRDGDGTDVVFVTSCAEYALEGYRSYPVSYLLKPLTKENLMPVLEHCLSRWREEPFLNLDIGEGGREMVPLKEICYIEVFRRELVVHCAGRDVTGTGALSAVIKQLPATKFYRSHRSFLVNLEWVTGIQRYHYILKDRNTVPIAVRSYAEAQQKWLDYFS